MQKRLDEIIAYLGVSRTRLLDSVAQVHPSFAVIRPRSGTWSVAEILAHLALVEGGVAQLVTRSVAWGREKNIGPETSEESVMSSLDQAGMLQPDKPRKAPERVAPPHDSRMEDAVKSLTESRRTLLTALSAGDGMDLAAITRTHPSLGELNLYQWALFVGQHEERHAGQIERTLRELTESAAESAPIF